jgi:DnaJ-domain-containing protein 1
MSLGHRLWRVARRRVLEHLGLVQGSRFNAARAWAEMEEFLRGGTGSTASAGRPKEAPRTEKPPRAQKPPRAAPPHPFESEYRLLGAPVGSDLLTVRRCWRRLVRETHPDHFAHDPEQQRRASERLRQVNAAYFRLRAHLTPTGGRA